MKIGDYSLLKTDRYYSTRELAKLFRVNESTIKRWADKGELKCFKTPGGHRKYTPEHVVEFISKYRYEILPFGFHYSPELKKNNKFSYKRELPNTR